MNRVLYVAGACPRPHATAAGVRTTSLLHALVKQAFASKIVFACPQEPSEQLQREHPAVDFRSIEGNQELKFRSLLEELAPHVCIFDRFFVEEMFGWLLHKYSPRTVRILDTQDLHFLREARKQWVETSKFAASGKEKGPHVWSSAKMFQDVMGLVPQPVLQDMSQASKGYNATTVLLRELAAINRSDGVMVCSEAEHRLLTESYDIPAEKLSLVSFLYNCQHLSSSSFHHTQNFVTIGNFKHAPNRDSLNWMRRSIWPRIRKHLERAKLSVYGADATCNETVLTDRKNGFMVEGELENIAGLGSFRVLLAPLRFGAGVKGKILDAWAHGVPVVTTPVGAEGIGAGSEGWGGLWTAYDCDSFVRDCISVYKDPVLHSIFQENGRKLLSEHFNEETNSQKFVDFLDKSMNQESLNLRRSMSVQQAVSYYSSFRASEYMSRYIELKNLHQRQAIEEAKSEDTPDAT